MFVSEHCTPCQEVKRLLENGDFLVNEEEGHEVDLVDVETEAGFAAMVKLGEVTGIPSAYEGKRQCAIRVDEEDNLVILECPNGADKDKTT